MINRRLMNKADDSHTPDAIRFINQRNKIVLKEFIKKNKTKPLFQKKNSPKYQGITPSSRLVKPPLALGIPW